MVILLHGENNPASRQALADLKAGYSEIVTLDGKSLDQTMFIQASQSASLFGGKKLLVVENYFSSKKASVLPLSQALADVVFWEDRQLGKTQMPADRNVKVKEFPVETSVFKLVDALYPENGNKLLELFWQALKNSEPEFLFLMIARQFRLMLAPAGLPPWQEGKVKKQAAAFGTQKLSRAYQTLLVLDTRSKNGRLLGDLKANLEQFLLWI